MLPDTTHSDASTQPTFETGIVMAGAISAGAYSAGVMDFIIEALDAYEEAKKDPNWDGPRHNVRIPVLAGASAGGMTAAISALQLFHDIEHVSTSPRAPEPPSNRLYSSWVTDISIESLLETDDLNGGRVKSLLCSEVLDRIANAAFDMKGTPRTREWIGRGEDRTLKVLLTLSNLRGVPYSFKIFGNDKQLGMLNHGDYVDFTLGIEPSQREDSHVLDLSKLTEQDRNLFKNVVLATGAFPIGLSPRRIERPASDYWTAQSVGFQDPRSGKFQTIYPSGVKECEPYPFLAVDGGMINNEPLEITRRYLLGTDQYNNRNGISADKAIILLAPFPHFANAPEECSGDAIFPVFSQLVSALINQARFKPDELEKAENDTVFSRFMISPSRDGEGSPIASGLLGGFSGFLHKSFRRHDYLLGRRNAQQFLRRTFALPETNNLFNGFDHDKREKWYVRQGQTCNLFAEKVGGGKSAKGLPIIPLVGKLQEEIIITPENLPSPRSMKLKDIEDRVKTRVERVVRTLIDIDLHAETGSMVIGAPIRWVAARYGKRILSSKANSKIRDAVVKVAKAFDLPQPADPRLLRELSEKLSHWKKWLGSRLTASPVGEPKNLATNEPRHTSGNQNRAPVSTG